MKKLWHIIKGWVRVVFPNNKEIAKMKTERLKICKLCKNNSANLLKRNTILNALHKRNCDVCLICGCVLIAKCAVKEEYCPLGYWETYEKE